MRSLVTAALAGVLGAFALLAASAPLRAQGWNDPVRCASNDGHYARCVMPWRDARLMKQESRAACVRGDSWGVDRGGVLWVDRGCRGLFVAGDRWGGGYAGDRDRYGDQGGGRYDDDDRYGHDRGRRRDSWRPGPGWDRQIGLQCDSNKKRYQMCRVDVGRRGHVRLVRQMSDARCTEGYSWGWNRAGVWVAHGCRGRFVVDRRW
ncbi:MAG TPA: DUF3011 domain-containing protein [Dyella sp.]|nr:DUF3011 domain-containing protein [Dyella sp.]